MSEQIIIADTPYQVNTLTAEEKAKFENDYAKMVEQVSDQNVITNDIIRMLMDGRELALKALQAQLFKFGGAYEGKATVGAGMTVELLKPDDIGDIAFPYLAWSRAYPAPATYQDRLQAWFADPDGTFPGPGTALRTDRYAACVIFGEFIPNGASAVHNGVKVVKNGKDFPMWMVDYNISQIFRYPYPIIVLGEESVLVQHFAQTAPGTDVSQPIGIKLVKADTLRVFTGRSPLLNK